MTPLCTTVGSRCTRIDLYREADIKLECGLTAVETRLGFCVNGQYSAGPAVSAPVALTEDQVRDTKGPLNVSATPMFVRRMKGLLRRALGREILSYEELLTLCFNCEGIINSYPLTYRSEDLIAIPPDTFLMPNTSAEVTDLDLNDFAKFK
ncbi:hypothetical protein TNCV_4900151 [Trichonephila clavipes]|nr:hypothetical protein TNCV_4900151 [Trichonephila clavipes]